APPLMRKKAGSPAASSLLAEVARMKPDEGLARLNTAIDGLGDSEAGQRLEEVGPNELAKEKRHGWLWRLMITLRNPLVILLAALAIISFATGDSRAGIVMSLMVALGVVLRFIQESRADSAAAKLKAMITITATAIRAGQAKEIPLKDLVPGDIVRLSAGDMIPADLRILSSKDLFIVQSALTGESLPVEKFDIPETRTNVSQIELINICFLGTSVESGTATGVVLETGSRTYLGSIARSLAGQTMLSSFDQGINRFTWLMIRFMIVLLPLVFLINLVTKGNLVDAFFFSLAVAVG